MAPISAGLLLHRGVGAGLEVLIGKMGGPFWAGKEAHSWSIPKGLHEDGEDDSLAVAEREFAEEVGSPPPAGPSTPLGEVRSGGKRIVVFGRAGDFDADTAESNTFTLEWPPRSGRMQEFPEMDRLEWVTIPLARHRLAKSQLPFLDRLVDHLNSSQETSIL